MANDTKNDDTGAWYEYRVWGRHKRARKLLAKLGDVAATETIEDCYFLSDADPEMNVKVRADALKIKRLVGQRRGFDHWVARRHRTAKTAPPRFDGLLHVLRLDKAHRKGYDLAERVARLDPDVPVTPVFVTKQRTRYRVGALRAEITDITIDESGEVLHTLAIEGEDVDALAALRKQLGLKGEDNVAVHLAIEDAL